MDDVRAERLVMRLFCCPIPVRESLGAATVNDPGCRLWTDEGDPDDVEPVALVYCGSDDGWGVLESVGATYFSTVAIIVDLKVGAYARALALGASGVVHFDTPAAILISVARAASRGETVLPSYAARSLAAHWVDQSLPSALSALEQELLVLLGRGEPIQSIASVVGYSDRTIRRRLQSLYLKLGASDRRDALRIAADSGLVV